MPDVVRSADDLELLRGFDGWRVSSNDEPFSLRVGRRNSAHVGAKLLKEDAIASAVACFPCPVERQMSAICTHRMQRDIADLFQSGCRFVNLHTLQGT